MTDRLYLRPDQVNKYTGATVGEEFDEWVRLNAVRANPAEFGVEVKDKVKELEWRQIYSAGKNKNFAARGLGGEYRIEIWGRCLWWPPEHRGKGNPADNLEAAKAAAQAHFQKLYEEMGR